MKKICPYFVASTGVYNGKPDFWGAVSFKNVLNKPVSAMLKICSFETGQVLKSVSINLQPQAGRLLTNQDALKGFENQRLSLELSGSKTIHMTPLNARRDSSIAPLKVIELEEDDADPLLKNEIIEVQSTPWYSCVHKGSCRYLKADVIEVLNKVFAALFQDYPDTKPFFMGPACPLTGYCPGNTSHRTHQEVDFDYPTYSGLGTQYAKNVENIWIRSDPENMILDESKVNGHILWQFLVRLKSYCSDDKRLYQFVVHQKVINQILDNISSRDQIEFNRIVTPDVKRNNIHYKHFHLKIVLKV